MAPLVPDIIGNELNFVVAIFIGIAFGYILEQAGFSTSKKLVGLFYGYDFTVLRVFFTAGITAMLGVVAFGYFGILDINLIYINPTFIYSALVGGFIMGLGFIIGGFCPGTSVCAAAIGKIDAMIFVAGSFLGVYIFAEGYPLFEGLYKGGNWGSPKIFEILGMSQSLFAFLMTFVAVFAFIVVTKIEAKVNGKPNPDLQPVKLYAGLALIAIIIGISAFAMPDRQTSILEDAENKQKVDRINPHLMTSDELAFRIIDKEKNLQIFDFRSPEAFSEMSLPGSVNYKKEDIFGKDFSKVLLQKHKINVIVADDEETERKIAFIMDKAGYSNIRILKGGMNNFVEEIINFKKPLAINSRQEEDTFRFREKAAVKIPELIKENKNKGVQEKKQTKRVLGGC